MITAGARFCHGVVAWWAEMAEFLVEEAPWTPVRLTVMQAADQEVIGMVQGGGEGRVARR